MARPKYPSDDVDKTVVRFPPGLMDRIKRAAKARGRSMNTEIIVRLERSLDIDAPLNPKPGFLTPEGLQAALDSINHMQELVIALKETTDIKTEDKK